MHVIAINGSPHKEGNTFLVLRHMCDQLQEAGITTEIIQVGSQEIHGCIGCDACQRNPQHLCIFGDDLVNETALKLRQADGFILGSPTYYAGIAGAMKSFLDRTFYTSSRYFAYKVATAVSAVRRAGGVDVLHQLHNFLQLAQTVLPPSQYWPAVYGHQSGETPQDAEGMQTARRNAQAMAWLLKSLEASRDAVPLPEREKRAMTNFIR